MCTPAKELTQLKTSEAGQGHLAGLVSRPASTCALVVLILVAGCSGRPAATGSRKPRHADAEAAIARCVKGIEITLRSRLHRIGGDAVSEACGGENTEACHEAVEQREAEDERSERAADRTLADACADVYVERACREASWQATATTGGEAVRIVLEPCAAAYCPLLPTPRPGVCAGRATEERERGDQWAELRTAIRLLDLGETAANHFDDEVIRVLGESMRDLTEANRARDAAEKAAVARPTLRRSVLLRKDGVWLAVSTGKRAFVARCAGRLDAQAVQAVMCTWKASEAEDTPASVELAAADGVAFADIATIMDATVQAGFRSSSLTHARWLPVTFPDEDVPVASFDLGPSSCNKPLVVCHAATETATDASPAKVTAAPRVLKISQRDVFLDGVWIARTADVAKSVIGLPSKLELALRRREPVPAAHAADRIAVQVEAEVDSKVVNRVFEICSAAGYIDLAFTSAK